jgi:hypothetical protein
LHQERELSQYTEWTPETTAERQRKLATWALERLHVEMPEGEDIDEYGLDPEGDDDEVIAPVSRN